MSRRQYAGGAAQTTLTGSVASSGAVTITISASTGWPDGSTGPFAVVVDPGTASEEKILVTSRSGTNLTVGSPGRGYDGTSATAHSSGAVIYPTVTAVDLDEANAHVNLTAAAHAATAISNTPAGNIAATTVQAALNELDTEKASSSHTQASSTITDFTEAVQDIVGAMFTDGTGIDSSYNDGAGTLTVTVDPTEFASDITVRLARAATQTYTTGSGGLAKISWDTETVATSWVAATGNTLTVPAGEGGWYLMRVQVLMQSGTIDGQAMADVNGTSTYQLFGPATLANIIAGSTGTILLKLSAGDTVAAWYQHGTGSSKTITATLEMVRVSN